MVATEQASALPSSRAEHRRASANGLLHEHARRTSHAIGALFAAITACSANARAEDAEVPSTASPGEVRAQIDSAAGDIRRSFFLVGGGPITPELRARFLKMSGGEQAKIGLIPLAASLDPKPNNKAYEVADFWGDPNTADHFTLVMPDETEIDDDKYCTSMLRDKTALWFPGGQQPRLVNRLRDTALLSHIKSFPGVIGGTSAGASAVSKTAMLGMRRTMEGIAEPVTGEGLGLLKITVDQHVDRYDYRIPRLQKLVDLSDAQEQALGIGIPESTAVIVDPNGVVEVIGASRASLCRRLQPVYELPLNEPVPLSTLRVPDMTVAMP